MAVGLSAGFLGDLESSGIGLIETAAYLIGYLLPADGNLAPAARQFNEMMCARFERVVDFLKLHYAVTRRDDTAFWRDNADPSSWPPTLRDKLALWRSRPPHRLRLRRRPGDVPRPRAGNTSPARHADIRPTSRTRPPGVAARGRGAPGVRDDQRRWRNARSTVDLPGHRALVDSALCARADAAASRARAARRAGGRGRQEPRLMPAATTPATPEAASTTISDVAHQAGVSIKTVSRDDEQPGPACAPTREPKILLGDDRAALSAEAGRRRSLAGARSFLIGLLYFDPSAAFISGVQQGATMRCRGAGYHLVVEVDGQRRRTTSGEQVHRMVSALRPDGMITTPPLCDNPHVLKALHESGTPTVLVSPARQRKDMPSVRMDDVHAAEEITNLLLSLGHRRIAFIRGAADQAASALRHQGFVNAMKAARVDIAPELIIDGDFRFESGVTATHQLLKLRHHPTAVFASNDDMALGVLAAAQRQGLAIPGDLAIAGFDDSPASSLVWPPLTTMRQPTLAMARTAVDLLVGTPTVEGTPGTRTTSAVQRVLPHELIVRDSTSAPARATRRPVRG